MLGNHVEKSLSHIKCSVKVSYHHYYGSTSGNHLKSFKWLILEFFIRLGISGFNSVRLFPPGQLLLCSCALVNSELTGVLAVLLFSLDASHFLTQNTFFLTDFQNSVHF